MSNLNMILVEVEASAAKVKSLEAEIATERERAKTLVKQYRNESDQIFKVLGVTEKRKERKARTHDATLMNTAIRTIRQVVKSGEKNVKAIVAAATEAAEGVARAKLGLSELPQEIKAQIEQKAKKSRGK